MNHRKSACVFPSPTEIELGTIPGTEPGTAMRVRVEPGPGGEGYARIEQLAWSEDLGWYSQKSFCVPGAMINDLVRHLRKADCFIPHDAAGDTAPIPFPGPSPHEVQPPIPVRRDA